MRSRCCWAAVPRRRRGRLAAGRPYDRIHVTCGITRIPCTWVTQCRPGALIVLPWLPTGYAGHRLRLHVGADGRAIGRFHGGCGYMMMRSQRSTWNAHHADPARTSTSLLDPRAITTADPGRICCWRPASPASPTWSSPTRSPARPRC